MRPGVLLPSPAAAHNPFPRFHFLLTLGLLPDPSCRATLTRSGTLVFPTANFTRISRRILPQSPSFASRIRTESIPIPTVWDRNPGSPIRSAGPSEGQLGPFKGPTNSDTCKPGKRGGDWVAGKRKPDCCYRGDVGVAKRGGPHCLVAHKFSPCPEILTVKARTRQPISL